MNDRRFTVLLFFLPPIVLASFLGGFWMRGCRDRNLDLVRAAADKIKERYVTEVDEKKLYEGAISGMVGTLDEHSKFFPAEDWNEFNSKELEGRYGGVGIEVGVDRETGFINVVTPMEDTPAFREDVLPGDKIVEVDGESTKGKPIEEVTRRIKGKPGTEVTLTLWRKGRDPFPVKLTRAEIKLVSVRHAVLDGGVGYVRVTSFTEDVTAAFDRAVADLQGQAIRGLIVDLRFNGGGYLEESRKLSDRFLPEGVLIVSTKGRNGSDTREARATAGDDLPAWPLAVLVNEGTASASEIFAGAMKDNHRGSLVGARTYGKGSVQTPIQLADGSVLKLTTAKYYTPSGRSVHREPGKRDYGLEPDFLVEMSAEEYAKLIKKWNDERVRKGTPSANDFRDLQLDAALEVVKAKLESREPKVDRREVPKDKKIGD